MQRRLQHHHPVRPRGRAGPHRRSRAAGDRRRASSPDPQGPAHLGRPRRRDRRSARGASFRAAGRLRRRGDQPLSRLRDARRHDWSEFPRRSTGDEACQALHQVDRQGPPEGHVQDGHLDLSVLLRRADLRRGRPARRLRRRSTSPAPPPRSRASASTRSPRRRSSAHRRRLRRRAGLSRPRSTSAASMPTACAARRMPGRRTTVVDAAARRARQCAGHVPARSRSSSTSRPSSC